MSNLGNYMKQLRNKLGFSLAKVSKCTGITDSRLSKAENGADDILNPLELKSLASLYEVAIVPIYILAGYLDVSDLEEYRSGFKNIELLDEAEKKHVQNEIDFLNRKKVK